MTGREDPGAHPPFTVVLPVFNEERALVDTIAHVRRVLDAAGRDYELLLVDDGSSDATPALLAAIPGIRVLTHASNRGYGAALKSGIRAASHPLVVVMDVDGTYPPEVLPTLLDGCATADMVVGARVGAHVVSTPLRSSVKWCFRQYAQWITNEQIPDLNSGVRAFHRDVAERFMDVLPDGFSFTTTITVGSLLEGLTVRFVAIDYLPRIGTSKLKPLPDTWRIGRQLLRLGVRFAPLRTSALIAAPLLIPFVGLSARELTRGAAVSRTKLLGIASGLAALAIGARGERAVARRRSHERRRTVPAS